MADHDGNDGTLEYLDFDTAAIDEDEEEDINNINGTDDEEHWNDVDPSELENDFNFNEVLEDQDIDLKMITEKLNCEDAEINSNKSIVGRSLLHIALLFLFLWATFYGLSSTALKQSDSIPQLSLYCYGIKFICCSINS